MVERLLESGGDPNVSLKMGETPLMTAARSGDLQTVERLLEYGADVNAVEHERGQTALMWAVAQQHGDVARLLIESDADLHAPYERLVSTGEHSGKHQPVRQLPDGARRLDTSAFRRA